MTPSTRTLTLTLAALAIAVSTVSGVLYGATDAAYAAPVDRGPALLHGHRMVAHTVPCPACKQYHLGALLPQGPGPYGGKEVTMMKARRQDATAAEAAVLAQKLSAILTAYRLGHIHIRHCDIACLRH
jgi:hypothetical protein